MPTKGSLNSMAGNIGTKKVYLMLQGLSKAQKCSDLTIPLDTKPNAMKNRKKKVRKDTK